ncbi:hypothetical protein GH5_07707 [Leishmania sp. Ghana 2012 LV757]|uniref:hypothetical protein n=1 Tax=Leishmania sp. Ghana 2012 LV757 TaxID=2803181 RepID=UPI001B5A34CF|nr:hypothetical protein GH5_07707 [Leishmania sp. Ghana 2012 LV757]
MDIAASDKVDGSASGAYSLGSRHRHTHRSGDTESSECRTKSSKHHRHHHHQLNDSECSSRHHKHRSTAGANSSQGRETAAVLSDNDVTPCTATERRDSQAQESRKQSLHDAAQSSRASTTPSSRLPIRRHERLSATEAPGEPRRLSVAVASSATAPASSAASEVMRIRNALARPNGIAVPPKRLLEEEEAPLSPSSSSTFSGEPPARKSGDASAHEPSTNKAGQHGSISSSKMANRADGAASASQPSTRQHASPLSEAAVAPPSPATAALASLEADPIEPGAMVRSWQQDVDPDTENLPSSLSSSVYRWGDSAARTVPPPPAPRLTSSHRPIAGTATGAPSSSAASTSQRAHVRNKAEALSRGHSNWKRPSEASSQCGTGKARSEVTEDTAESCLSPVRHRSAAASLGGVPAAAEAVLTARQPPSVRSHTSSVLAEVARRSNASARAKGRGEPRVTGGAANSADQRLPMPESPEKESRGSSRDGSGSYPPPPASASFPSAPAVAAASSLKAPQKQAIQRSFQVAAAASADNGDAATPKGVRGSATPRSCSGSHGRASSSRREYQVSVTSRITTSVEPFQFNTERRSTARRTVSPCYVPPDPLAELPPEERQRLVNLPHRPSAADGISRLDITFEEDAKELYRQTYLVDPLLRSRPGRRQFYIPEQADLFGMYAEPPLTVDEDGNKIIERSSPIPIRVQSFLHSEGQQSSQPQQQRSSAVSPSGSAGHDTDDESAQPPPTAPAFSVRFGKAAGADASGSSNGNVAAQRPGRGLSSFVSGYGEETNAKGRSGLTSPRGRVVSDITALYRRNMAANTGRTGYSQRGSLMRHCVASPCGPETSPSTSAKSSSPGTVSGADMSRCSTPFIVMRPKPSSQSTVPSQDQPQQCGDVMVVLSKDEECGCSAKPAATITLSAPTLTAPAALVIQLSSERGAGSGCRHSKGIFASAKLTAVPSPTRVNVSTAVELDAASAATAPKLKDAQSRTSIDSTTAAVRRSRRECNSKGVMRATEKGLAESSVTAGASPPSEVSMPETSSNSSRARASFVAAAEPSEPQKAPTDSRRGSATSKPTPRLEQREPLQSAASEPPAPPSETAASPTLEASTHSLGLSMVAPSTVVDSPPEPQISTASRHADPASVSMSSLSDSSPALQCERLEKKAEQESATPTETRVSVPATASAALPSSSPADAPPPLPPPPLTKPAADAGSRSEKPLTVHEGSVPTLARYRHEAAATAKDGTSRKHCCSRRRESGDTASAAHSDTPARSRSGSMPPTALSATSTSRAPSMSASSSRSVVGAAAAGHRGSFSQAPHVFERGTQTEFVFVLDDLQGRQLLQRQQEQLLANLQLMQSRLQLQQQPQSLLQILNAGSCSPSTLNTSSQRQMSPSPQSHASESAGLSAVRRQRRGYYVNDSSAVRDALRWTN